MPVSAESSDAADLTQLVRYVLVISNLNLPDDLTRARQVLLGLGLIVDQVNADGIEVATTQAGGPGADGIRAALAAAGYRVVDVATKAG